MTLRAAALIAATCGSPLVVHPQPVGAQPAGAEGRPHLLVQLKQPEGVVTTAAFSPDGRQVLTAGAGGWVWLWDTAAGATLRRLEGHEGGVTAAAVSGGGGPVRTAGRQGG